MSTLEKVSHAAVIVTSMLLCVTIGTSIFHRSTAATVVSDSLVGRRLQVPTVRWDNSALNVVLAVSSHCHYCANSKGFYQRLSNTVRSVNDVKLIAILPDDESVAKAFFFDAGVHVDSMVSSSPLSNFGVVGTPTILLVGSDGIVVNQWNGFLSEAGEREVLRRVTHHGFFAKLWF